MLNKVKRKMAKRHHKKMKKMRDKRRALRAKGKKK